MKFVTFLWINFVFWLNSQCRFSVFCAFLILSLLSFMHKAAVAGAYLFRGDFICDTLTCMLSSSMKQRPDSILTSSPTMFRNRSAHELKTSIPSPVSRTTRKIWPAETADAAYSLCRSPGPPAVRYLTEPEYSSLLFSAIQLSSEIFVVCGKKDLHSCWFYAIIIELSVRVLWQRYAAVAQLDRVTGYEPVGRGFESLQPYHVAASVISLAANFFKFTAHSFYCGSYPNRTRCAGLRFG